MFVRLLTVSMLALQVSSSSALTAGDVRRDPQQLRIRHNIPASRHSPLSCLWTGGDFACLLEVDNGLLPLRPLILERYARDGTFTSSVTLDAVRMSWEQLFFARGATTFAIARTAGENQQEIALYHDDGSSLAVLALPQAGYIVDIDWSGAAFVMTWVDAQLGVVYLASVREDGSIETFPKLAFANEDFSPESASLSFSGMGATLFVVALDNRWSCTPGFPCGLPRFNFTKRISWSLESLGPHTMLTPGFSERAITAGNDEGVFALSQLNHYSFLANDKGTYLRRSTGTGAPGMIGPVTIAATNAGFVGSFESSLIRFTSRAARRGRAVRAFNFPFALAAAPTGETLVRGQSSNSHVKVGPVSPGSVSPRHSDHWEETFTIRSEGLSEGDVVWFGDREAKTLYIAKDTLQAIRVGHSPGTLMPVSVARNDLEFLVIDDAIFRNYLDVPVGHRLQPFVEAITRARLTSGCGDGNFCPDSALSRRDAAEMLVLASHGWDYITPPASGARFLDVHKTDADAAMIEQLARDGVTAGCGDQNYCPDAPLNRAEAAVFVLLSKEGRDFRPPEATGFFTDVPVSSPFVVWVEELARRGITGDCGGGKYCPDEPITRGEMAAFISLTFALGNDRPTRRRPVRH